MEWDGNERRRNVDEKIQALQIELASSTASVKSWMETTTEYRQSLCGKIDEIRIAMSNLPCKERKAWYQAMNRQVGFMWAVIAIFIGLVVKDMLDRSVMASELKQIRAEIVVKR